VSRPYCSATRSATLIRKREGSRPHRPRSATLAVVASTPPRAVMPSDPASFPRPARLPAPRGSEMLAPP
jgi:hypothetical protein